MSAGASYLAALWASRVTRQPVHTLYTRRRWELRGNNARLHELTGHDEIVLVGAAGTGKTLAILDFLNEVAWTYPGARILIVRKVRADLADSVLVTFERDILGEDNPICAGAQRQNRMVYRYPNRSEIALVGMDRPGRVLSAEYDVIYVPECVQLSEGDWETLIMRNRSTAVPFQLVIGDTNPDRPNHWVRQRERDGRLLLLTTYHEDNPKYWDGDDWTEDGRRYVLGKLDRLTGLRRKRYREGLWVLAEGAIYEDWRHDVHVIDRFDIPAEWRRVRVVDFGYTNPFVCQWWALDGDGRMYLYREIYATGRLVSDLAREINALSAGERILTTVCDHDAEGRAQLEAAGISTVAAEKAVKTGIEAVALRLRAAGDGRPRLFLFRDALVAADADLLEGKLPVRTADEVEGYVWDAQASREQPVKEHDHGLDAMRYAVMYFDGAGARGPVRRGRATFGGGA